MAQYQKCHGQTRQRGTRSTKLRQTELASGLLSSAVRDLSRPLEETKMDCKHERTLYKEAVGCVCCLDCGAIRFYDQKTDGARWTLVEGWKPVRS